LINAPCRISASPPVSAGQRTEHGVPVLDAGHYWPNLRNQQFRDVASHLGSSAPARRQNCPQKISEIQPRYDHRKMQRWPFAGADQIALTMLPR